ncbi:MAG: ComEC/Rec2 family competence protein, partial [Acidimicrobiia bacterium]
LEVTAANRSLPLELGNAVRERVMERLEPFDPGRALLAGFLIGETGQLPDGDMEAMRRSGLAHFVAVSGSNVALFLGLVALVAGPLAAGPRRRAVVGLAALPVYVAATRFEPSVMRASVMAGLALGGRLLGIVLETWQLLSLAVVLLLVADPALARSLGFQLSVAATAGVVIGARWPLPGGRVVRALAVTMGAQVAVAPLLLIAFGSVPLLSPIANLLAAPLVAASTVIGAVGVAGPELLIGLAAGIADLVLWVARGASVWPQLGLWPTLAAVAFLAVAIRFRLSRPYLAMAGTALLVALLFAPGVRPPDPGVVVLDVGQGDAILIHGGEGRFALVDGGPDPAILIDALRGYGVGSLEVVVLTHVHADHAVGLAGLVGWMPIGQVWAAPDPHVSEASQRLFAELDRYGIIPIAPRVGSTYPLGTLELVVEGPLRPYASPNDQSIVLMVKGPSRSMLLAGDIEMVAQAELTHLRAEVLKVPHQGAATSDPGWLQSVGAELAVISVGPNDFGHPAPWVVELLEASGARVLRTDHHGDVVIPLG